MEEKFIPLSVPNLRGNELKYVTAAIEAEWVSTAGPYIDDFEKKISTYVGALGAVSCQNGTAGLHIALILMGITKDDMVIVPTLTFIAAVNPIKYIGAEPVFMDCDDSLCVDSIKLRMFCEEECTFTHKKLIEKKTGRHIKAVLVVHVFGNMADMEQILEIASLYNLRVIEDATEALGTYYTGGKLFGRYAGTIGDIGVYSFNGNKIMTTGGGGMIVSNNTECLKEAKHLTTQAKSDELYYMHDEIGYNYRMTNLQAALGLAQLERLEEFIETKNKNYCCYVKHVNNRAGLSILPFRSNIRSNHWFYALVCSELYPMNRDELINYLSRHNIQSRPIWGLIHKQIPYKTNIAYKVEKAEYFYQYVVNIPCSTNLTEREVMRVIDVLCGI